ncbi:MAG: T9SS type A sorting domain-containing protein [bacterium]
MVSRKIYFILLFIFASSTIMFSQEKKSNYTISHSVKFGQENSFTLPRKFVAGSDSIKVVAIMVQFVEDSDGRTSGNGLFDRSNRYYNASTGRDTVIDSPPYDSSYFADHLQFLKNYFAKSSKGKLNLSYDLYGRVINLPRTMEQYSPQRNESNVKLGNLFQDAWSRADSFINFSQYDKSKTAFVIFHAGVGRDVDLTAFFGFDPTPFDLPSVFIGLKNLKEFYGNSYNGFQTSEGLFIQNSLIIPSTELRELQTSGGTALVELGMNGILTASLGSYLGLPDLFNTSTGVTAIGRFGLMDGQSIFSFNGLFPPEPSAWEKIYLGWVNPVIISSGSNIFSLPTSSKDISRDTSIYKVLMSSKEYFLVENRNRDPENDGQKVYTRNRSFNDSSVFFSDTIAPEPKTYYGFVNFNTTLVNGNVTDVQTLDWSLPGVINSQTSYRGGILIWHIDENVIDAKISSNTINNDINHRGVDLEEAKGAQLIGVTFSSPFGNITGDGTEVDYWFSGSHKVPSSVYKNAFTPTSFPNSLSYSLANNNISITNFSTIDTLMTFNVSIGAQIKPISGFPKNVAVDTSGNSQAIAFDFIGNEGEEIFVNSNNKVYGYTSSGSAVDSTVSSGLILNGFGKYIPTTNTTINHKYIIALADTGIVFKNDLGQNEFFWSNAQSSCPPFSREETDFVYVGRSDGKIFKYTADGISIKVDSAAGPIRQFSKTSADTFTYITNANKYLVVGNISTPTSTDILIVNNSNEFILNGSKINLNYTISRISSSPILADINSDGKQEIIFVGDDKIYALNSNGVLIDNFPADFNEKITSGISVADINNDNIYDLLFASSDGDLFAYGIDGRIVSGFPVKIGPNTTSTPALANLNDTLGIVVVSGDGYLYGFKTNTIYNPSKVLWKNYLKDKYLSNNNFVAGNSPVSISEKLPSDKVYNWPNPVYKNETFIRYYINGTASSVNVKILDLSGELVTTLKGTAFSKADNEVKWDVSSVQSGIYYGVVEADIDGSTETKIIKIAVVK